MPGKPISLHKHRVKKLDEEVDEAFDRGNLEHSDVPDALLEAMVEDGRITLAMVTQLVWAQAKKLDEYEHELNKLKLIILEAARE